MPADYPTRIDALCACEPAVTYATAQASAGLSYQEAWDACERGDWLLWLLGRTTTSAPWSDERKPLVAAAMECARQALPIHEARTGKTDVREASDVILAWTRGEATVVNAKGALRKLRAAYAADDAAAAAAYAAADATYVADDADATDAADDAAAAADAVAAAYAYVAEDADTDARSKSLAESAAIVRRHFPHPPELPDV